MRRLGLVALLALALIYGYIMAGTIAEAKTGVDRCPNQPEVLKTAAGSKERARKGWDADKVKKDPDAIARVRIQARCAPTKGGRKAVRYHIVKAKQAYKEAKAQAFYDELTAAPGQARLAVLRQCESTNRYNDPSAPAGAYGMLQGWSLAISYWTEKMERYFGYPSSPPYTATPAQQDIAASLLYQHHGTSPWECPF